MVSIAATVRQRTRLMTEVKRVAAALNFLHFRLRGLYGIEVIGPASIILAADERVGESPWESRVCWWQNAQG